MSTWVIKDSFHKTIFDIDLEIIESWNDIIFFYSKIANDTEVYKKNYLFFTSSTNSPFSREEILSCLEYAIHFFTNEDFVKSLTKENQITFFEIFMEIKAVITKEKSDTFYTSVNNLI